MKRILIVMLAAFTLSSFGVASLAAGSGSIVGWGRQVVGPTGKLVAIDGGYGHSLGLKSDGSVVVWGYNDYSLSNVPSPNTGFIAIAAGRNHSLGLKSNGSVVAWGNNYYGESNIPSPNTGFVAIAAGAYHSLGLKSDGSVVAWGNDWYGQCGIPSPNTGFVAIAMGGTHSLGLKSNGSIVAWGSNDYGLCNVPSPNSRFVAIAAGGVHSLALKSNGSVIAWGDDWHGLCNIPSPNTGFVAVAAGINHSLGLRSDGSIAAWGYNHYGQCNVPSPNTDFVAIAAGGYHSLGLKSNGSIVAWGSNEYNECDVPSPNSGFVAISAGEYQSFGIQSNEPASVSVMPSNGSLPINARQTITAVYADVSGNQNLSRCSLLMNTSFNGANSAYLLYDAVNNRLYVRKDDNSGWIGGNAPGSGAVIQNSRCKLYCAGTRITRKDNYLTISFSIELKPTMLNKSCGIWMMAKNKNNISSGWKKNGQVTLSKPLPINVSISPNSGFLPYGKKHNIVTIYADPEGNQNLSRCSLLINTSINGGYGVYVMYNAVNNSLYLSDDTGRYWIDAGTPGSGAVLQNSQCKLYCAGTKITRSGNNLAIVWSIEFKPTMLTKSCEMWMNARNKNNVSSDWDSKGRITVKMPVPDYPGLPIPR